MPTVMMLMAALSSPAGAPALPGCTPLVRHVAGQEVFCCTTVSGEQCCSPNLDGKGQPTGCDCRSN